MERLVLQESHSNLEAVRVSMGREASGKAQPIASFSCLSSPRGPGSSVLHQHALTLMATTLAVARDFYSFFC